MARTMTSRAFNQDTGAAARAAKEGPVFITNRGEPSLVLLSMAEYQRLTEREPNIIELLAMPEADEIELAIPPRGGPAPREVDLS